MSREFAPINPATPDEADWISGREVAQSLDLPVSEGELSADHRVLQAGGPDQPQLHEARFAPGVSVRAHAHDCAEIIYVTQGELHLGRRVLEAGSSVFIDANTLYSFKAGPHGMTFINFRTRGEVRYISKEQYLADRSVSGASARADQ